MNDKMDVSARKLDEMKKDARAMDAKMDANAHKMDEMKGNMESRMDANMQALRGDMGTQRGEMQSMGLSLQASLDGMKGIMAAARGGATEPTRGSANCVRPAMETGEVGTTSDATTIIGETETCRVRHEGTTEEPKEVTETKKLTETKSQEETEIINEVTETEKSIEGDELNETKDEHTHVESGRDNGVELVECFVTRCEQQDSLLKEQRETVCSLEADRDEVSPVEPCEVEGVSDVNGYTRSLGGKEIPGPLV